MDKPLYVQLLQYIAHALGDFRNIPPAEPECDKDHSEAFPNTVKLSLPAAEVAWIIGVLWQASLRQCGRISSLDRLFMGGAR